MNPSDPAASGAAPDPAPPALSAALALAHTRRFVIPPMVVSCVVSVAAVTTFLDLAVPLEGKIGEALNPLLDRFLGNAFSAAIVVVFLSAAIYAALQAIGIAIDRNRLSFLDASTGTASSSGLAPLLALLSGRSVRLDAVSGSPETAIDDDPFAVGERYGLQRRRCVDQSLALLRYVVWVLPLLGFIGTVVGISDSIAGLESVIASDGGGQATAGLMTVLDGLRFAFDTTLLGLATVIPVMAFLTILERLEDALTGQGRNRVQALVTMSVPTDAMGVPGAALPVPEARGPTGDVVPAGQTAVATERPRLDRCTGTRDDGAGRRAVRLSLLPFVDIVFGTIGVFTVVFAVQNVLEAREGIQPGVDSIVTCVEGDRLTAHWPDGAAAPAVRPDRSLELLDALGNAERPLRSMILALSGACEKARRQFLEAFERYSDVTRGSLASDRGAPPYVMLELYPIGGAADAQALLERWRSDGDNE